MAVEVTLFSSVYKKNHGRNGGHGLDEKVSSNIHLVSAQPKMTASNWACLLAMGGIKRFEKNCAQRTRQA
jgi:hypothetical protein